MGLGKEIYLDRQIQLWCGEHDALCFHANVGSVKLADGRFFNTGLPKGFPDLLIIKQNETIYVETKIKPNKPSIEQINFIRALRQRNIRADIVYSMEEFIEFYNGNTINYIIND